MKDWILIIMFLAAIIVASVKYNGFWTTEEQPNKFEIGVG
jgi:hypothetical protein